MSGQALEGLFGGTRRHADANAQRHRIVAHRADKQKRLARLNLICDILSRLHYAGKKNKLVQVDPEIAFEFTPDCIRSQRLAS